MSGTCIHGYQNGAMGICRSCTSAANRARRKAAAEQARVLAEDGKRIACPRCALRFSTKAAVARHARSAHSARPAAVRPKVGPGTCPTCGERWPDAAKLLQHRKRLHGFRTNAAASPKPSPAARRPQPILGRQCVTCHRAIRVKEAVRYSDAKQGWEHSQCLREGMNTRIGKT